jgi:hypothetical protein
VSFAAITLCVASQRVFIVVSAYFVFDSIRKLLDTRSYTPMALMFIFPGKPSVAKLISLLTGAGIAQSV